MRPSFDDIYIEMAALVSRRSTCKRRAVGCVIADKQYKVLSTGYNGVPTGDVHCTESPCIGSTFGIGEKLDRCSAVHAEQNALMQCSNVQDIHTIYCTTHPCAHCSKMIANTSCKYVIYRDEYTDVRTHGSVKYVRYSIENNVV